jgi:type II secretory pathway predicted ATPase ExeA
MGAIWNRAFGFSLIPYKNSSLKCFKGDLKYFFTSKHICIMITEVQKEAIRTLVEAEKVTLRSQEKVAVKCGVNAAVISLIVNRKWDDKVLTDITWRKVGQILGVKMDDWQIAEITNLRQIETALQDAKQLRWFLAISHKAGSGKSETCKYFAQKQQGNAVYRIECREWSRKEFLLQLCKSIGINTLEKGYKSLDDLLEMVIQYFATKTGDAPLLLLDEADKLKPAALRVLIPLYNALNGKMGVVICGTDNLEKEIKSCARRNVKGYDEISSRFGRKFVHLVGATQKDVAAICAANGIEDAKLQYAIFQECEPRRIKVENTTIEIVDDLRRVRRVVERELLRA